jgi:hypothetical protein
MKKTLFILSLIVVLPIFSQHVPSVNEGVFVDYAGVMRWIDSNAEVSLFGVNYTTPFAYSFRAHQRLGLSLKKAIDLDVAQMKRLGFDAFRVHVWEKEISDSLGNLLQNEHLDLFDYLLAKLSENGIKTIVTPIAWWGTGWPEPDIPTTGYTRNYGKGELITNPVPRKAQRNYLKQFIEHVNPYKKLSYKNDPSIIAVEIINEPRHPDSAQQVTDYINEMAEVLRSAGLKKPIFYNISETWSNVQANAVTKANIDGVTFQWYPTGLVHGSMLHGNYLVNVNRYKIPSDSITGYATKAKMVYEFDAADIGGSYMYPAMARSYREAGMQFATMFAYDPTQIAWSNTEYPTHFMNLLYTPSKAISLMIAGKAFRHVPRSKSYGNFPENNQFENFRVSYEQDLSEMNTDSEFYYSNTTNSTPRNGSLLQHIAGIGNSTAVKYDGTGAYFLDKLEEGIWRLEVYPDALWIRDPFEQASMLKQVARLFWNERTIQISIPDLGDDYVMYSLSGTKKPMGKNVIPGIYLVARRSIEEKKIKKIFFKKEKFLEDLYIPSAPPSKIYVVNNSDEYSQKANPGAFKFQIAGDQKITNVQLYIKRYGWRGYAKHWLKNIGGFQYALVDTPKVLQTGLLEYCVAVESGGKVFTYPEGIQNEPWKWDFSTMQLWHMNVLGSDEAIVLVDAMKNRKDFVFPHFNRTMRYEVDYKNGSNNSETALALSVTFSGDNPSSFFCQTDISNIVQSIGKGIDGYTNIVIKGRAIGDSVQTIGINFMATDGENYGANVEITNSWNDIVLPISALKKRERKILPDSYPLFLEKMWYGNSSKNEKPEMMKFTSFQFVINPSNKKQETRLDLVSIRLTK